MLSVISVFLERLRFHGSISYYTSCQDGFIPQKSDLYRQEYTRERTRHSYNQLTPSKHLLRRPRGNAREKELEDFAAELM